MERSREAHIVRMRSYTDASLNVTAELKEILNNFKSQVEFDMERIEAVELAADSDKNVVTVNLVRLDGEEMTWEPVSTIYARLCSQATRQSYGLSTSDVGSKDLLAPISRLRLGYITITQAGTKSGVPSHDSRLSGECTIPKRKVSICQFPPAPPLGAVFAESVTDAFPPTRTWMTLPPTKGNNLREDSMSSHQI